MGNHPLPILIFAPFAQVERCGTSESLDSFEGPSLPSGAVGEAMCEPYITVDTPSPFFKWGITSSTKWDTSRLHHFGGSELRISFGWLEASRFFPKTLKGWTKVGNFELSMRSCSHSWHVQCGFVKQTSGSPVLWLLESEKGKEHGILWQTDPNYSRTVTGGRSKHVHIYIYIHKLYIYIYTHVYKDNIIYTSSHG